MTSAWLIPLLLPKLNHFREMRFHARVADSMTEAEGGVLRKILIEMLPVSSLILGLAAVGAR